MSRAEGRTDLERRYIARLRAEGIREETIRQRINVLRRLGKDPQDVTVDDVLQAISGQISPNTRATYFRTIRTIFLDMEAMGVTEADPTRRIKTPKAPRREPRPLPEDEVSALLRIQDKDALAWSVLGLFAGLRSCEVVTLTGLSLQDGPHGLVLRVVGKGGVDALIPAHDRVIEVLGTYAGSPDLIWPIWAKSMARAWQREARAIGVIGRTFHQLRHTYATRLYRATNGDLLTVAALCRHASVATTQGYAKVASDAPHAAMKLI